MPTLEQLITQTRRDLQALIKNSRQTDQPTDEADRLRRVLADLQKRLEATRE